MNLGLNGLKVLVTGGNAIAETLRPRGSNASASRRNIFWLIQSQ